MTREITTDMDPEDFITELDEIREMMAEEPFNEVITDKTFMIRIINAMPAEYDNLVETLEIELGNNTLTLDILKTRLRTKFKRIKKRTEVADSATALIADNSQDSKKNHKNAYNKNNN